MPSINIITSLAIFAATGLAAHHSSDEQFTWMGPTDDHSAVNHQHVFQVQPASDKCVEVVNAHGPVGTYCSRSDMIRPRHDDQGYASENLAARAHRSTPTVLSTSTTTVRDTVFSTIVTPSTKPVDRISSAVSFSVPSDFFNMNGPAVHLSPTTSMMTKVYEVTSAAPVVSYTAKTLAPGYMHIDKAGYTEYIKAPQATTEPWFSVDEWDEIWTHPGSKSRYSNAGTSVQVPAMVGSIAAVIGVLTGMAAFIL